MSKIQVVKRDGRVVDYDKDRIRLALRGCFKRNKMRYKAEVTDEIDRTIKALGKNKIEVEEIQDIVESILMRDYPELAKSYILFRKHKEEIRKWVDEKEDFIRKYSKSFNTADATVDDNSNVGSKNMGVLNAEIHKEDNIQINRRMVVRKLRELFPDFDAKQYERDLANHYIYKHDESSFGGTVPYCASISMYPFLNNGIKDIGGLSAKPKNLDSYCGIFVNMIFAIASQFAGAIACGEFFLYFCYFARKEWGDDWYKNTDSFYKIGPKLRTLLNKSHYWCNDVRELRDHDFGSEELNKLRDELVYESERPLTEDELKEYKEKVVDDPGFRIELGDGTRTIGSQVRQYFQQVIYSINQPAAARGMQSAFVNFSYYDKAFFEGMFGNFTFPDATKPIWEDLDWVQKDFMQWFNEERLRCLLTFPVETTAMVYKDGKFLDPDMAEFVAQEYARGHSFFTYISDSVDSLSSCCRLKNMLTTREFNFTNGNVGIMTGSKSVITLNLNRIIQETDRKFGIKNDWKKNIDKLKSFLSEILDDVYKYHIAYNELLWDMKDAGLLPVYDAGFIDLNKQYLTIGINGLNQAAEYLDMTCNDNNDYKEFCQIIFSFLSEKNKKANGKFNGHIIKANVELVPAESLSAKNRNWDKEDGYWVPEDTNLYASYIFKPNDPTTSPLEKLRMHGREYIGDYLDGGSAAHINLSEHLDVEQYRHILKYAADQGVNYFTFNIPNSECDDCGWIGKRPVSRCPVCGSEHIALWDRIIGYLTKIKNWSEPRRIEQKTRIYGKL